MVLICPTPLKGSCNFTLLYSFLTFFGRRCSTQNDNQVIVVIDTTQSSRKAAKFLYNKHPGCSSIVAWEITEITFLHKELDARVCFSPCAASTSYSISSGLHTQVHYNISHVNIECSNSLPGKHHHNN